MKVSIPANSYVKGIEINDSIVEVNFAKRQKVALLFIALNEGYWGYLAQCIKDCKKNFLPHHTVEYFVWTDFTREKADALIQGFKNLLDPNNTAPLLTAFTSLIRLYSVFYPDEVRKGMELLATRGLAYRQNGTLYEITSNHQPTLEDFQCIVDIGQRILTLAFKDIEDTLAQTTQTETGAIGWPAPTLMRYHLFLNQEEKLKEFDHIYYLDADMRVVDKVSDEILSKGLTTAPHPGYAIAPKFIPPYEPNPDSQAYIPRLGRLIDENGKKRFMPFYAAGGFQGGISKEFIKAMQTMKERIDADFDKNYTAIWNDESHWNKYLWDYKGPLIFLDPSYVYPDSLIKEYYEPLWGRSYIPKIITLTKPFSLSAQGAEDLKGLQNMPQ